MGYFQRMSLRKVSSKITAATYDFRRSLDEDFVRFESYLEAEILVSNFSLYELSVNRRKNITF